MALLTEEQLTEYLESFKQPISTLATLEQIVINFSVSKASDTDGSVVEPILVEPVVKVKKPRKPLSDEDKVKRKAYYELHKEKLKAYGKAYHMADRVKKGMSPVGKRGRPLVPPELRKKPKYKYVKKPKKPKKVTMALRILPEMKKELSEVTNKKERAALFQSFINQIVEFRKDQIECNDQVDDGIDEVFDKLFTE